MSATVSLFLATEGGIPASSHWAKLAVPIGFLVFIGFTYLLVRSNLGTRRGYLVTAASLFGFLLVYALFWTFGAPGTPPNTGPQNLPGQELDAYQPVFRMFAPDSLIAEEPEYAVVQDYPNGFTADPPEGLTADVQLAIDETKTFFSDSESGNFATAPPLDATDTALTDDVEVESETLQQAQGVKFAEAENGYPIVAIPYVPTYQIAAQAEFDEGEEPPLTPRGEPVAADGSNLAPEGTEIGTPVEEIDGEPVEAQVFFAYFDAGNPYFPSFVTLAITFLLFVVHMGLLFLDESRERRENRPADEVVVTEKVRVEA